MALMIQLPDPLLKRLQLKAKESHLSVEEFVLDVLSEVVEEEEHFPTPEEVALKIKSTPPDPSSIRPAVGSLAEALRQVPSDPDFDMESWMQQWHQFEQELKDLERRNRIAEGRD
jgi:plasmid stability protein